jgi:intracellular septation protein A
MAGALRKLFADFFSTIVFLAVYAATGDILIATGIAIAGAIAQFIRARIKQEKLDIMTWASLALVIVLGGATLLTKDPRFVLLKPAIGHFAIGTIMLRKDWMLRYAPPMVRETVPHIATVAGYVWAAFIFALGLGVVAVAMTGDIRLWAIYVSVVAVGAKIVAFGITWIILRIAIARKLRAAASARGQAQPAA